MSQVCTSFRDRCRSDHLWARIIKEKWGRVIGDVAYKEWQWHLTKEKEENLLNQHIQNGSLGSISGVWPNICLGSFLEDFGQLISCSRKNNFMRSMYISLESGKFWFPAQIYRGLVLCNALLSYDSKTDNFQAREQTGGWHFLGKNISWDMLRSPRVETPFVLHVSDCLDDLKPGDHIEIQWRPTRERPYEMYVVEFKQYPPGSSMRRVLLSRTDDGEQTDKSGGFYGGTRKLQSEEEIERWKKNFEQENQVLYDSQNSMV
ncbi:hypothetical protein L6164_002050 [Bauhinia variegata]|uniref:Uncharacterized protein n=1 Tax=Bauhinia variegata TaxID=167791 RepID=A0ACB9Q2G9_BAUVA|nr:hypothetical protein L6164_002050 [Bauhinia variegata]